MKTKSFLVISVLLAFPLVTGGWGQYGHEQVNDAAVQLLIDHKHPLAGCFAGNRAVIARLAITPDKDWKLMPTDKKNVKDPNQYKEKVNANRYEHPLHFFEADAFVKSAESNPQGIVALPSDGYLDAYPDYRAMLSANSDYVLEVDPSKKMANPKQPTMAEVAEHGTAPWRIAQLFKLGVNALKQRDFKKALMYLGTMGHYVGDMGQPFHATLNFDGDHYPVPAAGIHHSFETAILEDAATKGGAARDNTTFVWNSFAATQDGVMRSAGDSLGTGGLDGLAPDRVIPEVLKLVASSYPYIGPLLKAYSEQCAAAEEGKLGQGRGGARVVAGDPEPAATATPHRRRKRNSVPGEPPKTKVPHVVGDDQDHGSEPTANPNAPFCVAQPTKDPTRTKVRTSVGLDRAFEAAKAGDLTALEVAAKRMGSAAALLARLWAAAYAAADAPLEGCGAVKFEEIGVLNTGAYPKPDYFPTKAPTTGN